MKYCIVLFVLICCWNKNFACSCEYIPPLCEVVNSISENEFGVVFIGEYIQQDSINDFSFAFQFKIESVIMGEIITQDSILAANSLYQNTDSTVWVIGGIPSLCYRLYDEGSSLFASFYSPGYGYSTSICSMDYFPVTEENKIGGHIWDINTVDTISIDDFDQVIAAECLPTSIKEITTIEEQISIYPNPNDGVFEIDYTGSKTNLPFKVINYQGHVIRQGTFDAGQTQLNLSDIPAGIYLVYFTDQGNVFSKKMVVY